MWMIHFSSPFPTGSNRCAKWMNLWHWDCFIDVRLCKRFAQRTNKIHVRSFICFIYMYHLYVKFWYCILYIMHSNFCALTTNSHFATIKKSRKQFLLSLCLPNCFWQSESQTTNLSTRDCAVMSEEGYSRVNSQSNLWVHRTSSNYCNVSVLEDLLSSWRTLQWCMLWWRTSWWRTPWRHSSRLSLCEDSVLRVKSNNFLFPLIPSFFSPNIHWQHSYD